MIRLENIVVGVDFTPCSRAALAQAARIATRNDATLHVFHVIQGTVLEDLARACETPAATLEAQTRDDARRELETLLADVDAPEDTRIDVAVGRRLPEMLDKLERVDADALVLGVYGASGPHRGIGDFAMKCVRKSPARLLLVHEDNAGPFRTIVAGVDFSEISRLILERAARVARFDGSTLHALHVYYGPWHTLHYRSPTPEASPHYQKQYVDRLEGLLEDVVGDVRAAGFEDVEILPELVEHQNHGRGLVEFARDRKADLVILGSQQQGGLLSFFLGSTAERVLRELPCSVFVIKPTEHDR